MSKVSTTLMMSDYEEDFDDVPTENVNIPAESMVGAFRAESTDQWTAASGITAKIPPFLGGSTSWFKYEELIGDWLDLAVLEESKRISAYHARRNKFERFRGFLELISRFEFDFLRRENYIF